MALPDDSTHDPPLRSQDQGIRVLVFTGETYVATPISPPSELVIGRGPECGLQMSDGSISRAHVRLYTQYSPSGDLEVDLEDLGSANGTRIEGRVLKQGQRYRLGPNGVAEIGSATLVVQRTPRLTRPRRVLSRAEFITRVDEERDRARIYGLSFGVISVRAQASSEVVESCLVDALRSFDVMTREDGNHYRALLLGTTLDAAGQWVSRLKFELNARGVAAEVHMSAYPEETALAGLLLDGVAAISELLTPKGSSSILLPDVGGLSSALALVDRVAAGLLPVMVVGEIGAGKDTIAEEIHQRSSRRDRPLVKISCGRLAGRLAERDLTGWMKGAFEGALHDYPGLLEQAQGGTVVLEEIAELPASVQQQLLSLIDERKVVRLGASEPTPLDVRFIATTSRDPAEALAAGTLRKDLYYRLNGVSVLVPPLRERAGEIEPLARMFGQAVLLRLGSPQAVQFTPEASRLLQRYGWPGNVRELKNVIERAVLLASGEAVAPEHLPAELATAPMAMVRVRRLVAPEAAQPVSAKEARLSDEARIVLEALDRCAGNQTRAATMLGISRGTLLARLDAFGIPRPRKTSGSRSSSRSR